MRFCLQAPYLSSSDSSIGGKMSRLGGWWLLTDLLFDHLKTGNISGSARLLSTRTFQRIQVTSHCWNSVRNIPLKSIRDQIYCCLSLSNWTKAIAQKSDFCHMTPIFVDDPFLALDMTVNFPPWKRFFDFPIRSYSCFRKKIRLTAQTVFPPPTVGAPSASNSPGALSARTR